MRISGVLHPSPSLCKTDSDWVYNGLGGGGVNGLGGGGAHDSTPHDFIQAELSGDPLYTSIPCAAHSKTTVHLMGRVGLAANQPKKSGTFETLLIGFFQSVPFLIGVHVQYNHNIQIPSPRI